VNPKNIRLRHPKKTQEKPKKNPRKPKKNPPKPKKNHPNPPAANWRATRM
jgi:hypothetical protein